MKFLDYVFFELFQCSYAKNAGSHPGWCWLELLLSKYFQVQLFTGIALKNTLNLIKFYQISIKTYLTIRPVKLVLLFLGTLFPNSETKKLIFYEENWAWGHWDTLMYYMSSIQCMEIENWAKCNLSTPFRCWHTFLAASAPLLVATFLLPSEIFTY